MGDVANVEAKVRSYCGLHFLPPFQISEIVDINSLRQRKRGIEWPHSDQAGCYVMYGEDKNLLYIGLAGHFSDRLNKWFRYNKREDSSSPWTSFAIGTWETQPKFLQTIQVHHAYEAPSLEAFLIGALQPRENILLKNSEFSNFGSKTDATSEDWTKLGARFDEIAILFDKGIETNGGPTKAVLDGMAAVEKEILEARAVTIDGLRVKARAACWSWMGDWEPSSAPSTGERMALSIVMDIVKTYDPQLLRPGAVAELLADLDGETA